MNEITVFVIVMDLASGFTLTASTMIKITLTDLTIVKKTLQIT